MRRRERGSGVLGRVLLEGLEHGGGGSRGPGGGAEEGGEAAVGRGDHLGTELELPFAMRIAQPDPIAHPERFAGHIDSGTTLHYGGNPAIALDFVSAADQCDVSAFGSCLALIDTLDAVINVGGRYVDLSTKLTLNLPPSPANFKVDKSWFDPTIGLRFAGPIGERWSYGVLGDIGGFGVGSDLTWQLTGSLSVRMTEHSLFTFGYRYIAFDYEEGQGLEAFKIDLAEHGPALGFRFEF